MPSLSPSPPAPCTAALCQQEAWFEQRLDTVIAQLYLARAEAARLCTQSRQHRQAYAQLQRDYEQLQREHEQLKSRCAQVQDACAQLQRDYQLLHGLLRASHNVLTGAQPLTPEL